MGRGVFPLERYLKKVVAIHTHCTVLTKYAHSPRLRHHFHSKSLEVRSVPPIITTVPRPSDLGKLIEDTLEGSDSQTDDSDLLEEIISVTHKRYFRNGGSVQAPVHCECALVYHFNNPTLPSDQSTTTLMDYLGVSKLSCNACARFIEASNKHSKRKFYTRGCHGKWYFPWAPPQSNQQVSRTFRDTMSSYIANMLAYQGVERPSVQSDSSLPSTDSDPGPRVDEAANVANHANANASWQRRGGFKGYH